MEGKAWKKWRNKLADKFRWDFIPARRKKKRGKAKGGIITVNKELQDVMIKQINKKMMEIKVRLRENK